MESRISGKKFGVKEVIRTSIEICHGNFKQFFLITLLVVLMSVVMSGGYMLIPIVIKNPFAMMGAMLFWICVVLVIVYFTMRISIVLYYSVHDYIFYRERTFGEKYAAAGKVIWKAIGTSLLLGLMFSVIYIVFAVIIAIVIGFSFVGDGLTAAGITIIVVASILTICGFAFLGVKYYLALFIRMFDPERANYFASSSAMVKGKFWQVLGIWLIPTLIQLPIIGITVALLMTEVINQAVYSLVLYSVSLVLTPYIASGIVIMYLLLDDKSSSDQVIIEEVVSTN